MSFYIQWKRLGFNTVTSPSGTLGVGGGGGGEWGIWRIVGTSEKIPATPLLWIEGGV